jgi:hypothetical protein
MQRFCSDAMEEAASAAGPGQAAVSGSGGAPASATAGTAAAAHHASADAREVIRYAHRSTVMPGSSTVCLAVMKPGGRLQVCAFACMLCSCAGMQRAKRGALW